MHALLSLDGLWELIQSRSCDGACVFTQSPSNCSSCCCWAELLAAARCCYKHCCSGGTAAVFRVLQHVASTICPLVKWELHPASVFCFEGSWCSRHAAHRGKLALMEAVLCIALHICHHHCRAWQQSSSDQADQRCYLLCQVCCVLSSIEPAYSAVIQCAEPMSRWCDYPGGVREL